MEEEEKKKMAKKKKKGGGGEEGGKVGELMERLPQGVLMEILSKLDLESLCSAAPVCRTLRLLVTQTLSSISTLDLSEFSPDAQILNRILKDNRVIRRLTLNCFRLDDSSVKIFARESLQELVLLKGHLFSSWIFYAIGETCTSIRLLMVEIVRYHETQSAHDWNKNIAQMLKKCLYLENLFIKFQAHDADDLGTIQLILPETIKVLLLQPMSEVQAKLLTGNTMATGIPTASLIDIGVFVYSKPIDFQLRSLTLVLNRMTDGLLFSIVNHLHLLAELCLEDRPAGEPSLHHDLTNSGLQSLGSCIHLTHLSLTRSRQYYTATFKRVNDMGIFLLAEGCKNIESIRLAGFSRVTDAGYVSILYSCKKLRRFEVVNAFFLSDLTFHNLADAACSLIDVRLVSCNLLTSASATSLCFCESLEVLDLSGCKSIGDLGLSSISKLCRLTSLDLGGADITDSGLSVLGCGRSPIASLCLRGCKRVTDRGVASLLLGDGTIQRTLSALDLGYLPGISDKAIYTIVEVCMEIKDLCLRFCFSITDSSLSALGSMEGHGGERRSLKRLDLYRCSGLSVNSSQLLCQPYFRGLRWLGIGNTTLSSRGSKGLMEISHNRPWLSLCEMGCEMDCKDGWQFHKHVSSDGH